MTKLKSVQPTFPISRELPSRPRTLAVAVSMAVGSVPVMAFDNQVEVWLRPGTDRHYGGIDGVLPLTQSGTSLSFADLKFKLGQNGSYEGNVGLGYRFLTDSKDWSLGLYGAWDHRNSGNDNAFNQITVGAEALSENLDFRFNYYFPLTDRAFIGLGNNFGFQGFGLFQSGVWEEAMQGYDVEGGVLLPISDKFETRAYAAYYSFEGADIAPQTDGWRVRLEVRPTNNISIGLSHQQDDMFEDQTSLEMRYTFGKDGKSGVRTLKERMTDPWTRDIDIVISTPQEGAANRDFGKAVPGMDVIHIDSDRGSDVTGDGSYENPYASTDYCETNKCGQDTDTNNIGDYNVIRLWEGNSRTDGGYQPITLLGGQMLAGEPITARNIAYMHQDSIPFLLAKGFSGAGNMVDPVDPDGDANGSGSPDAPLINGMNGGGTAVVLGNNTSLLGVATIHGGVRGTNVSGNIDIMHNRLVNYYDGGFGIEIDNTNVDSNIRIRYNSINAGDNGIEITNRAIEGEADMIVGILGNTITVDTYYGSGGAGSGVVLSNYALNGGATLHATLAGNSIRVSGDGDSKYQFGGTTGVVSTNAAIQDDKYYGSDSQAYTRLSVYGNTIEVNGRDSAMGIALLNAAAVDGDGSAWATQEVFIEDNVGEDGAAGIGVYGENDATGIFGLNMTYGGMADQHIYVSENTIEVVDYSGSNSATGVALYNAAINGNATQQVALAYNDIDVTSYSGNATGIDAANVAGSDAFGKYYFMGSGNSTANQTLSLYGDSIDVRSYGADGEAYGIRMSNQGSTDGYYTTANATQTLYVGRQDVNYAGVPTEISVYAENDAIGIMAENGQRYYSSGGGSLNLNQNLNVFDAEINVYAYTGFAVGIDMRNDAGAGIYAGQTLDLVRSNVDVESQGGWAVGIAMENVSIEQGEASQSAYVLNSNIDVEANHYYSGSAFATGIYVANSADDEGGTYYGNTARYTSATQSLNVVNSSIEVRSQDNNGSAAGVIADNSADSRYYMTEVAATQFLYFTNTSIEVDATDEASGILASNFGDADNSGSTTANQTLGLTDAWIDVDARYYEAVGIAMYNHARGFEAQTTSTQTLWAEGIHVAARSQYYTATGVLMENGARAENGSDFGTFNANQSASFERGGYYYDSNDIIATSTFGNATGIELYNQAYTEDQSNDVDLVSATQSLTLEDMNVEASTYYSGTAIGISMSNSTRDAYSSDDAVLTASQTVNLSSTSVDASSTNGDAIGVSMVNSIYIPEEAGDAVHTATQTLNVDNYSDISAVGGDTAIGIYAANSVGMYYDENESATGTSTQTITVSNGSSIFASAYNATGVMLENEAQSGDFNSNAEATQSFSINSGSIQANGATYGSSTGIDAFNSAGAYYDSFSTASQSIDVNDSSVTAQGSMFGDAVNMYSVNNDYADATQVFIVSNSTLAATGKYQNALDARVHGNGGPGLSSQTVTVVNGELAGGYGYYNGAAVNLYASGFAYQSSALSGNTFNNSYSGIVMDENLFAGLQFLSVSGNTFNTNEETVNNGGGTCVGTQCAP